MHMVILAPGVFLHKLPAIHFDSDLTGASDSKIYPIEIHVGG